MATISFKADTQFKETIDTLAKKKGINSSAYIKLVLTKEMNQELSEITRNGMTVAEEMRILASHAHDQVSGPFSSPLSLMRALRK